MRFSGVRLKSLLGGFEPYLRRVERFFREYFLFDCRLRSVFGWSYIAWVLVLHFNPCSFADLLCVYTDHMRHEYVSWAFLQVGFKVFTVPLGELEPIVTARNPHPTWGMVPSMYPLGMIAYFLPFGILSNLGVMEDALVHKLMVLTFLTAAYLCVLFFLSDWGVAGMGLCTFSLAPVVLYLNATFWAMNGFYDVVPLLLVILAVGCSRNGYHWRAVILLSASIFMHYRALMYLPLLLKSLLSLWRGEGSSRAPTNTLVAVTAVSASMLALTLYTFAITSVSMTSRPLPHGIGGWSASPVYILSPSSMPMLLLLLVTTALTFVHLVRLGEMLSSVVLSLFWVYISLVVNWQPWHPLIFFPLIIMPEEPRAREGAFLWLLFLYAFLNYLLNPIYVINVLENMFSG